MVPRLLYFAQCTITLVYSVSEYCVPVCGRCAHVQHVDVQLNIAMRTVAGVLRPTNANWLLVLSNIEPHTTRRDRTCYPAGVPSAAHGSCSHQGDHAGGIQIASHISLAFRDRGCTAREWSKSNGAGDIGAVADSRGSTRP